MTAVGSCHRRHQTPRRSDSRQAYSPGRARHRKRSPWGQARRRLGHSPHQSNFCMRRLSLPPSYREYAQAVVAEIGREQMPSAGVEEQCMGMRRRLQLRIWPAACLLINTAWMANAAVLRNGKQVVNSAAVSRYREQLSVRRECHMPRTRCGEGEWFAAQQSHPAIQTIDAEGFHSAPRESLVQIYFVGHIERPLFRGKQNACRRAAGYALDP